MTVARRAVWLLLATAGCPKSEPARGDAAPPSTGGATTPTAPASASVRAEPAGPRELQGWYVSEPVALSMPAFTGVQWKGDDAGVGLGEGGITIVLGPDGVVTGTLSPPLGPSTIAGTHDDAGVRATVRGTVADDPAWAGTLTAQSAGDGVSGTVQMSSGKGNIIRKADFSVAKKP
jgi:hypothetical protein